MDFRSLSIRTNVSVLAGGAVGIVMAFAGFRVWALVGQQISRDLTAVVLLWKLSPWRPRLRFSWGHLKSLMSFSVSNFAAQLALFASGQAGSVILGLFFGPAAVGLYRIADRVVNSVTSVVTSSIQAVSLPEFSRLQNKPKELRDSIRTCVRLSSAVTLPTLAGVATVSASLMATIGPRWSPASDVVRILSLLGMLLVFASFTGPLLQALSRPQHLAALEWARGAVGSLVLVGAGFLVRNAPLQWQITGIACASFVTGGLLVTPVYVHILMRLSGVSLRDLARTIAPALGASLGVLGSVMLFRSTGWLMDRKPVVVLMAQTAVGGVSGLIILFSLESQLRQLLQGIFQRSLNRYLASIEFV